MRARLHQLLKVLIPVVAIVAAIIVYPHINGGMKLPDEVREHPLFEVYEEHFTNKALMGGICDLNDDGIEDIIVVYSLDRKQNQCVVILDGKPPVITEPDRAPLENVTIEFKNIDKISPMEFIIMGSKSGNVGYAICRIKDNAIYSLFDGDMDHCC